MCTIIARVIDNPRIGGHIALGPQMRNYTTIWHSTFSAQLSGNPYATFDFWSHDEDEANSQAYEFENFWVAGGGTGNVNPAFRVYCELDRELICFCIGCAWRAVNASSFGGFFAEAGTNAWFDLNERIVDESPKKVWSDGK